VHERVDALMHKALRLSPGPAAGAAR